MRRLWLLLLLVLLALPGQARERLKVGLVGTPPFLIYENGKPDGVDVRLWEGVARKLKVDYDYEHVEEVDTALKKLERGELDVVIGGIIITANRERVVDFTQPYYRTGSAILSPLKSSAWDHLRPLLRQAVIYGVAILCGCLVLVGTLLWLAERRVNHLQFSASPLRGIATGIWLALVTMSTVGYGDRVPVTLPGRLIAATWMIISMLFVSSLVAGIASSITVSQIGQGRLEKPSQLEGLRIAVVRGTYYEGLARRYSNRLVVRDSLDESIAAVLEGEADCVVYDLTALSYFMTRHPELPLHLSQVPFESQNFGWAMRPHFSLQEGVNVALLAAMESGELSTIERDYLQVR